MLRSVLCGYNDAYIVLKETIDLLAHSPNEIYEAHKYFAFENNVPIRSCISKYNSSLTENAKNLDIVMSMHNLLEYGQNYSVISGSLWNYYHRDEIDNANDNASDGKSFKYKTEIVVKAPQRPARLSRQDQIKIKISFHDHQVTIPLKYFSNVWRFLDLPLMNCEI